MFVQSLLLYLLLFTLLLPIIVVGIIILRKTSSIERFELLFPVGSILGILLFTFSLNIVSFFVKGLTSVILSYLILIFLAVSIYFKKGLLKVVFPNGKSLILYIISLLFWGAFFIWKSNYALIGSDTNLYYAIAHTFIKGNFPPLTPWQPNLPLAYHLGAFELLGAFYLLTGLSFQFLHLVFSTLFIFFSVQIFIWIWGKYNSLLSFLFANLSAFVGFVSLGFFYLLLPSLSINLPNIHNINEFILFLRNLPTVNQSIEVYGAPINLDTLIYFIFHAFGLSIFLSIVAILVHFKKNNSLGTWIILAISMCALALVSESIFVAVVPAVFVSFILIEKNNKTFLKNRIPLVILGVLTIFIILFQGGIITSAVSHPKMNEESIIVFPRKDDIKEDFISYHFYQEISKMLPINVQWLSLGWFHVGVDLLILVNILLLTKLKVEFKHFILLLTFFISGFTSLIAYNILVPKFLVANGNRFLSFSFFTFSLVICFSLIHVIGLMKTNNLLKKIFLTFFILWLFIPTIVPPLALLSKTRFGENKLIPGREQTTLGIEWIKNNLSYDSSIIILDIRAPHPSGQSRAMLQAGVFAPIFPGDYKAYTIEASPEYFDIVYYLSPSALKKLGIEYLLIDNSFFDTFPEERKEDLANQKYFQKIFDNSKDTENWEKIYIVTDDYLTKGKELEGSFSQYVNLFPNDRKIYIDNEENFNPSYLRRALIFSLRDKDLYYLPQSGVYLNVEADIRKSHPLKENVYDFLVLGKQTNPKDICNCQTKLIWKGLMSEVYVWQKI